ncbi:hypothetical protein ACFRQM_00735 [Streptomyces sp. NPDC056831]|uniref:hypothetical protein n=1 Tax=Streptomyces sp. NPDC056831 TaxID=3345954 RepID=UPI0036C8E07E
MTVTRVTLWVVALASFVWLALPLLTGDMDDLAPKSVIGILCALVFFCPLIAEVLKIRAKKRG